MLWPNLSLLNPQQLITCMSKAVGVLGVRTCCSHAVILCSCLLRTFKPCPAHQLLLIPRCFPGHLQTQTMKTAVESAQMLLRIDDIVSGISKKDRGGPGGPKAPQVEDPDAVDPEQQLPE